MALKDYYAGSVAIIVADLRVEETYSLIENEGFDFEYVPMFFFIDREGAVVLAEPGLFSFEDMVERIEPLLGD